MKVLHVITGLKRTSGGPARSSQGLVAAECRAGIDAWIYPFIDNDPWIDGVRKYVPEEGNLRAADLARFDLVHIHGIWSPSLHKAAVMCRKARVPYVISTRGMLDPWPLKQRWLKKRIARFLYQDKDIKHAVALHATAEVEAEQLRRLGFKNPIIISPNGVNVPGKREEERGMREEDRNGRRALFVSRMHPKKGVLELVEAFKRVVSGGVEEWRNWKVELVYTLKGDFEKAYEAKVKARILELGMSYQDTDGSIHSPAPNSSTHPLLHSSTSPNFILTGALDDDAKWEAYRRADLFVLPTHSENFGIVVAEALWAGVPVITTKGAPWADLEAPNSKLKCGWWIDLPDEGSNPSAWNALDDALMAAMSLSESERAEMGARGRKLVEEKYTWDAACEAMVKGYESLEFKV